MGKMPLSGNAPLMVVLTFTCKDTNVSLPMPPRVENGSHRFLVSKELVDYARNGQGPTGEDAQVDAVQLTEEVIRLAVAANGSRDQELGSLINILADQWEARSLSDNQTGIPARYAGFLRELQRSGDKL